MADFTATLNKLKQRGYWKVELYPSQYIESAVGRLGDCKSLISESSVELRGWDYPHVPTLDDEKQGIYLVDGNRCESWIDWSIYKEIWRFYRSGKFTHLRGLNEHWYDEFEVLLAGNPLPNLEPRSVVDAVNSIYVLTEMFVFIYNLTNRIEGIDNFDLKIELLNTQDNRLVVLDPARAPIHAQPNHNQSIEALRVTLSKADTVDKDRMLQFARQAAQNVFENFEWQASDSLLEEMQQKLLSRRF